MFVLIAFRIINYLDKVEVGKEKKLSREVDRGKRVVFEEKSGIIWNLGAMGHADINMGKSTPTLRGIS